MTKFEWSPELDTGNEMMDAQHRLMAMICKKLAIAYDRKLSRPVLVGICLELKKFADFHFVSEENMMREVGFPGLANHAKLHAQLVFELDLWIRKVYAEKTPPSQLVVVARQWLMNHIVHEDRVVAEFIRNSGSHPLAALEYGLYSR